MPLTAGQVVIATDVDKVKTDTPANVRDVLELGDAATLDVGTTADTVAAGNDARMTNARAPTAHAGTHATGQSDPLTPSAIGAATATQGAKADAAIPAPGSPAQGDILYHNGTAWVRLPAGTNGQLLQTAGTGANPAWVSSSGISGVGATNWNNADTIGTTESLHDVIYADGKFVAVGDSGTILTSTDGNTWTVRTAAETQSHILAICYGNSKFVAIARDVNQIRVQTSTDAITWNLVWYSSGYGYPIAACFANSTFVISTSTGASVISTDAENWTGYSIDADFHGFALAFGDNLFVATGNKLGSGAIFTSPDGQTWTERTSPSIYGVDGVMFGGGMFIAVTMDCRIVSSQDGVTWIVHDGQVGNIGSFVWISNRWVFAGQYSLMVSRDESGKTWETQLIPISGESTLTRVVASNSIVVAVGSSGTIIYSSVAFFGTSQSSAELQAQAALMAQVFG